MKLIGPAIETLSAEAFYERIKGLYQSKSEGQSKEVQGISITRNSGQVRMRFLRDPKQLTRDELAKLAEEYKLTELELLILFKKRKVEVLYASDDRRFTEDAATLKENAGSKKTRKRKVSAGNELQQLGDSSGMPQEVSVQAPAEAN
jgi:hypothetical protein